MPPRKGASLRSAPVPLDRCLGCRHFEGRMRVIGRPPAGETEPPTVWLCKAFPKRIPQEIVDGRDDHSQPVAGDHRIRFEPFTP